MQLWNQHHSWCMEHFYHPLKCQFLSSVPSPPAPGNHTPDFCPYCFAFPECHISGIIQYVAFHVWLLRCNIVFLRFTQAGVCISSVLLFIAELYSIVWLHHDFISSPVDEHLSCFQFLVVLSKAAIHIHIQVFVWSRFQFSWVIKWYCLVICYVSA